jgi:hypothetical protein
MMKKSISFVLAALLAGSASLAVAQTSTQGSIGSSGTDLAAVKKHFADQFAAMQDISGGKNPAWSLTKPTFSNIPADPTTGLNEREMQAMSSESYRYQTPDSVAGDYQLAQTKPASDASSAADTSIATRIANAPHVARGTTPPTSAN